MRLLIPLLLIIPAPAQAVFLHRETYTPATSQVSNGPHSGFTVRISVSAQTWAKWSVFGGQVQSASAYDIVPISTADCAIANKLPFKRISWSAGAGDLELAVYVSSFSQTTQIHVCSNDSTISVDQQTAGSLDSTIKYRFPMEDNAANTTVVDLTGTANGTNAATTSTKTTTGRIGKGLNFNGSTDFISVTGSTTNDLNATNTTVCLWAKSAATTGTIISRFQSGGSGTGKGYGSYDDGNWYAGNGTTWASVTASRQSDSAWHYYCWTYDGSNVRSYRNGSLVGGPTSLTSAVLAGNSDNLNFGRDNRAGTTYFTGDLDEAYKADAVRSADWLLTEYNMGTQSSFWSISSGAPVVRRRDFWVE